MLLAKEVTTSTYRYDADGNMLHKFIQEIKQYHYKNEEEKKVHKKEMESNGFADTGQERQNIGTFTEPQMVWFGSYVKYRKEF